MYHLIHFQVIQEQFDNNNVKPREALANQIPIWKCHLTTLKVIAYREVDHKILVQLTKYQKQHLKKVTIFLLNKNVSISWSKVNMKNEIME